MIPETLYMTVPCFILLGLFCLNWWRVMRVEKRIKTLERSMLDCNDFGDESNEDPRD